MENEQKSYLRWEIVKYLFDRGITTKDFEEKADKIYNWIIDSSKKEKVQASVKQKKSADIKSNQEESEPFTISDLLKDIEYYRKLQQDSYAIPSETIIERYRNIK